MKAHAYPKFPKSKRAFVLLWVVVSLVVLSLIAATVIQTVQHSNRAVHRAANWQEALVTADAGVHIAVAQITGALPDIRVNSSGIAGFSAPESLLSILNTQFSLTPGSSGLPLNLALTVTPPPLFTTGDGNNEQLSRVSIEILPVLTSPLSGITLTADQLNVQLVRIRSTGISYLDSSRTAGSDKMENQFRRPVLVWDKDAHAKTDRPFCTRTVEVMLRPSLPFKSGVLSQGAITVDSSASVFDSFNSLLPTTSTSGRYDSTKRLSNAIVQTNSNQITIPATVRGDVFTNGGNVVPNANITGTVDNSRYQNAMPLRPPQWSSFLAPLLPLFPVTTNITAGTALLPTRHKFNNVNGEVRIGRGMLGLGTHAEVWITGNFTGRLILEPGVRAKVYVQGNVDAEVGEWSNGSRIASNLQIYGLQPNTAGNHLNFHLGSGLEASIYAPEHSVTFEGNGHFSGSVVAASFRLKDGGKMHYDEALALNVGPMLGFDIVSWREIVPN